MKIFEILPVSIDFSTNFFNISVSFGGSAPEPPKDPYFLNFPLHFREYLDKIFKKFQKIAKFP